MWRHVASISSPTNLKVLTTHLTNGCLEYERELISVASINDYVIEKTARYLQWNLSTVAWY